MTTNNLLRQTKDNIDTCDGDSWSVIKNSFPGRQVSRSLKRAQTTAELFILELRLIIRDYRAEAVMARDKLSVDDKITSTFFAQTQRGSHRSQSVR